jgi:phosphoglycerol transferase
LDVRAPSDRQALGEHASLITLLAVLFGTIGGFAILVSMAGGSQVRVWDRIVVFIAFFSLLVVATWFERLSAWVAARRRSPRPVLAVLAVAVLAFGLWDGIPAGHPSYARTDRSWNEIQAFVERIEQQMPDGAAIFQIPVLAFPETVPPGRMLDYDPLLGFLHDDGSLRWSYGAIKGRPDADWQIRLRDHVGPVGALPALLGLGFSGLWVDTYGYKDLTEPMQIQSAVGVEALRSQGGRFWFFDLRPYRRRLHRPPSELRAAAKQLLGVTPQR